MRTEMSFASQFIEAFSQALENSHIGWGHSLYEFYNETSALDKDSEDYEKRYFDLLEREGLINNPDPSQFNNLDPSQLKTFFLSFVKQLLDDNQYIAKIFLNDESINNLKSIYRDPNNAYLFAIKAGITDFTNAFSPKDSSPEEREKIFSTAVVAGNIDLAMAQLSFEEIKAYAKKHPDILLNLAVLAAKKGHLEAVKVFFEITGNDSINGTENILSAALIHSRGPIVDFLLNNDKIKEKLSNIPVLLAMISGNKPPEMVASLLSKDAMAAVVATNADLIFKAIFNEEDDKTLALILQIPKLKEYFVAQNQDILAQIQGKKNGAKILTALLQTLNLGADHKNSKSIEEIGYDIFILLEDSGEVDLFVSTKDKVSTLSLYYGVKESALADKIISIICFAPLYKLKNQKDPVSLADIHNTIKNYSDMNYLYYGEKALTSSQLAEEILKIGENIPSGEELEKAIASVKNLKLNPILTEKITKSFFYQAIENAKDEQSTFQIIKKYPGKITDICSSMKTPDDLIKFFTQELNDQDKIRMSLDIPYMISDDWERHYGIHPSLVKKFITIAEKKRLCAFSYSEQWVKSIIDYRGSISHFIQNEKYKTNVDLEKFLRNLLNDETMLAKAYSQPEEILTFLQSEGVWDEEAKQAFLRVMQEKNLNNFLTKATNFADFEREIKDYPCAVMRVMNRDQNKEEVLKKLRSIFADPKALYNTYYNKPQEFKMEFYSVIPDILADHCLRMAKLEYEAAQKKAIANYPSSEFPPEELLRFAILNNMFLEAQTLYEKGARVSHEGIKTLIANARKENNPDKVSFLLKLFELKQGSLYANAEEFRIAAIHANKRFLAQPYQNGLNEGRWGNQGAIALLEDDQVIEVPSHLLYGISIAQELARQKELVTREDIVAEANEHKKPIEIEEYLYGVDIKQELASTKSEPVTIEEIVAEAEKRGKPLKKAAYLDGVSIEQEIVRKRGLVTLDEIVAEAEKRGQPFKKEMIGQVNVAALEAYYGQQVLKVKYRPNHDLQHSLRAAAYIYPMYQLFNANKTRRDPNTLLSKKEIECLQLMMLFSVLGREDETGFVDSTTQGAYLYQSYRAVDGFEFLSYCLENWDRYYKNVFADKNALYQAALVVELMGYPEMPDIEQIEPRPLMSILMQGDSPENMKLLKEWIQKYPNNNVLRAYSDEQLRALFPKEPIPYQNQSKNQNENKKSDIFLHYMNSAHDSDLLRCYRPGDLKKVKDPGTCFGILIHFYRFNYTSLSSQGKLNEISPAEQLMDYFKFTRNMLDEFGEKKTTDFESDDSVLKETLAAAKMLEKFLGENKGKSFAAIKDLTFERKININGTEVETLEALLTALGLEEVRKKSDLTPSSKISEKSIIELVPRFIAHSFLKPGAWEYTPAALAHCHYRINKQSAVNVPLSAGNLQYRDLEKEVETSLAVMEELPRPAFCRKTTFIPDEAFHAEMQRVIHEACKDGVAIFRDKAEMMIEFSSIESATQCFAALLTLGKIAKIPAIEKSATAPFVARAKISELEYAFIKPYLKYRQAKPPKEQNVESNLVAPTGSIAVLSLIDNYDALICNHNSRPLAGGKQTGVEWYFNQLEHPATDRPTRLSTLTEAQRASVHSLLPPPSGERYAVKRELKAPLPIEQQAPRERPLARSEYWREDNIPVARHVSRVRGQPKNTVFAKKSPHTLMIPRGQTLFQPQQGSELNTRYFPVGIVSDVNAVHTAGERYIWDRNVVSNDKFWIDGTIDEFELAARESMTLNALKGHLQTQNEVAGQWNELLVGGSKSAIKALACSGDLGFDNKTTLSYRLNLVSQAILLRKKYGVNVPLLIIEGDKTPYLYTEKRLLADIMHAIQGLQTDSYPYMRKENSPEGAFRLTCEEQMILIQFLETFTGHRFEGSFTLYGVEEEYLKKPHAEPYAEYTKKIDAENTKNLKAYLVKCGLEAGPQLKEKVDNLKLIGSESREREYLNHILATSPATDKTLIDLLIRNVALGHTELVKELINKVPEAAALLTKPLLPNGGGLLEVAAKNGELEMVKFLLSKNCDPHAKNHENVSPIDIVATRVKDNNNPHVENHEQILEALNQFKPATHSETRPGAVVFSGVAPHRESLPAQAPVNTPEQQIEAQEKRETQPGKP